MISNISDSDTPSSSARLVVRKSLVAASIGTMSFSWSSTVSDSTCPSGSGEGVGEGPSAVGGGLAGRCITVEDVNGCVTLEDADGCVTLDDADGCVTLDDADGCVTLEDADGCVTLEDADGCVTLEDADGCVTLEDADGCVTLEDADGCVTLEDADGCVTLEDADGCVTLDDADGCVTLDDADGCVTLEDADGCVTLEDADGCVTLEDADGCVTLEDADGCVILEDVGNCEDVEGCVTLVLEDVDGCVTLEGADGCTCTRVTLENADTGVTLEDADSCVTLEDIDDCGTIDRIVGSCIATDDGGCVTLEDADSSVSCVTLEGVDDCGTLGNDDSSMIPVKIDCTIVVCVDKVGWLILAGCMKPIVGCMLPVGVGSCVDFAGCILSVNVAGGTKTEDVPGCTLMDVADSTDVASCMIPVAITDCTAVTTVTAVVGGTCTPLSRGIVITDVLPSPGVRNNPLLVWADTVHLQTTARLASRAHILRTCTRCISVRSFSPVSGQQWAKSPF